MTGPVTLRAAGPQDVTGIAALVNGFAAQRVMLPRTPKSIALAIDDYVVAVDERGRVLACGALREYSPSLAEVAALAVSREAHGRGLGSAVVRRVEALARSRGIGELFALTLEPEFFEILGYAVTERERYPEKIGRDCASCARRLGCREICVRRSLRALPLEAAA